MSIHLPGLYLCIKTKHMFNQSLKLTVTKIGDKFNYQVIDIATGNILAERKSKAKYVAATVNLHNMFSRVDLAEKDKAFRINHGIAPEKLISHYVMISE